MNLSIQDIVSLATAIASFIGTLYIAGIKLAKIEVKVDTMWGFLMHRAEVSLINGGYGERKSPLTVYPEAKKLLEPLLPDLIKIYEDAKKKRLNDKAVAMEIEKKLGREIVDQVCIPYQMNLGECLIIALACAKEAVGDEPTVELNDGPYF